MEIDQQQIKPCKCPLCGNDANYITEAGMSSRIPCRIPYECPVCGGGYALTYRTHPSATKHDFTFGLSEEEKNKFNEKKYILSGLARKHSDNNKTWSRLEIRQDNWQELIGGADVPKDLPDLVDKIVLYLGKKNYSNFSKMIQIENNDYPLFYAHDEKEFEFALYEGQTMGFWEEIVDKSRAMHDPSYHIRPTGTRLTAEGWKRFDEIKREKRNPDTAFVAMWFVNQEEDKYRVNEAYEIIDKVLQDAGYKPPFRIDHALDHNNDICDEIIARIRKSSLVIADFTGNRGGVYFEAGFARGLGIDVVYLCQDDFFKDKKVHFDVEHYPFIRWKDPTDKNDLEKQLRDKIEAMGKNNPRAFK